MTTLDAVAAPAAKGTWRGVAGYVALLAGGVAAFFLIRHFGQGMAAPAAGTPAVARAAQATAPVDVVAHVIATLVAVIALGTALAWVFRFVGQPPVIGETIAGILLGPSLLGLISPETMHLLIPPAAVDPKGQVPAALKAVSQLGVILYMFLVGLELNAARLRHQARSAVAISHVSITVPFVLGTALALALYPLFAPAGVPFTSFALFIGVAMAITAFPVLARILTDRGLTRTEVGVVALSCAAADDVTAWCLLALVVGVTQAAVGTAVVVVAGAVAFIAAMFFVVRPVVLRLSRRLDALDGPLPPLAVSGTFLAVLLAAFTTEVIGIHAIFGAFLLGAVIPHEGRIAREFTTKLKDPVTVLLLPAFFAYTGMRTQLGLLGSATDWLWCGAIVLVATIGKFGGTVAAARLTGQTWRDATALGLLMNTRGLMELIVLNIGLDLGVISPTLFAMMVLMALVTTAMTSPLLALLDRLKPAAGVQAAGAAPSAAVRPAG